MVSGFDLALPRRVLFGPVAVVPVVHEPTVDDLRAATDAAPSAGADTVGGMAMQGNPVLLDEPELVAVLAAAS